MLEKLPNYKQLCFQQPILSSPSSKGMDSKIVTGAMIDWKNVSIKTQLEQFAKLSSLSQQHNYDLNDSQFDKMIIALSESLSLMDKVNLSKVLVNLSR